MTPLVIVRVIATVCMGLAAGIFLDHRRGVSLATASLPPSSFVQLQQIIHMHFVRMMPPLMLSATAGSLIWTIPLRGEWLTPGSWLVGVAAMAMLSVVVMTRLVNVPINNRLMTWTLAAPPDHLSAACAAGWRHWRRRADRSWRYRTGASGATRPSG